MELWHERENRGQVKSHSLVRTHGIYMLQRESHMTQSDGKLFSTSVVKMREDTPSICSPYCEFHTVNSCLLALFSPYKSSIQFAH